MSQPLAKVLDDETLSGPRGPDGAHDVVVPAIWLDQRLWVEVTLPRLLRCAHCQGGGCDRCDRSGAVESRVRGTPGDNVTVQLPPQPAVLRVPRQGGLAAGQERGNLLLAVRAGEAPSEGLRCLRPVVTAVAPPIRPPTALVVAGVVAVLLLIWLLVR